ncbi:F-box domain protein [Cooperia oncophora]
MLELIRLRMKRRFIEHLSIGKHFPWHRLPQKLKVRILQNLRRSDLEKCQLVNREMLELIRLRMKRRFIEHLSIGKDKELETFEMVVGNLPELLNNADVHRFELCEVPLSDDVLSSVLSCLLDAGCRVFKVWIMGTSMASVTSSVLLRFLREPSIKGSWFSSISDCSRDNFSPEVLQFIVTRKLVLLDCFRGFIPIYDDILAKLTAELFVIGAPNMITMKV